jgi:glyoxylate/hydroxypyruvate reductase A
MAVDPVARRNAATGILIASSGWNQEEWAAPIRAAEPHRTVALWPDLGDAATIGYALVWRPSTELFRQLPNLRVVFSLGAGVDHLVFRDDLPDVPIVRVVHPDLTQRMTEWVTLQVLMHHRRQRTYDAQQRAREWRELKQPAAGEVRVGIMGMGVLGRDAAAVLARLGFDVAGWSRRPSSVAGVRSFHGRDQLGAFLARTDILVSLLPLTPETRGILDMKLFRQLAADGALGGPVLINAGRGGSQVEADVVAALDTGVLAGASLDVFETEPLPTSSPLWGRENVILTPHCAASSEGAELAPAILEQIRAYEAGAPLKNVIDRAALY